MTGRTCDAGGSASVESPEMKNPSLALAVVALIASPLLAQQGPGVAPTPSGTPAASHTAPPQDGKTMRSKVAGKKVEAPRAARPYDPAADAKADVAAAVAKAKAEKKRVLVTLGANWCRWCRGLDRLFQTSQPVAAALSKSWVPVKVDVGRMTKNLDLAASWGADPKKGVPLLVVLDGDGKVVKVQDTAVLESEDEHDVAKVLAFLNENAGR